MCIGIPGVVIKRISDYEVLVDFGGIKKTVDSLLVPDIREGDYVIVHAGSIIGRIDKDEYDAIMETYRELLEVMGENE